MGRRWVVVVVLGGLLIPVEGGTAPGADGPAGDAVRVVEAAGKANEAAEEKSSRERVWPETEVGRMMQRLQELQEAAVIIVRGLLIRRDRPGHVRRDVEVADEHVRRELMREEIDALAREAAADLLHRGEGRDDLVHQRHLAVRGEDPGIGAVRRRLGRRDGVHHLPVRRGARRRVLREEVVEERRARMQGMRAHVREHDVYRWVEGFLAAGGAPALRPAPAQHAERSERIPKLVAASTQ